MQNDDVKVSSAKPFTNEWKLFRYLESHSFVTSRDSKYPPLEIMDLPKLICTLADKGYRFDKTPMTKVNSKGITKRYVEYRLLDKVELVFKGDKDE